MAPTAERTHYTVLGVDPAAGAEEIRRAHRQLARVLHPDRQADATPAERQLAERRMREVNAAWTVLSDPTRRTDYDRSLRAARTAPSGPASAAGHATRAPGRPTRSSAPEDADDPDDAFARARMQEFDPDEPELTAAHFWLLRRGPIVLALLVALVLFVMTAYAGGGPGDDGPDGQPPRTSTVAEDCVRLTDGRTAVRTRCSDTNDGRIITTVNQPLDCPDGTSYVVLASVITCVTTDPSVRSNTSPNPGG